MLFASGFKGPVMGDFGAVAGVGVLAGFGLLLDGKRTGAMLESMLLELEASKSGDEVGATGAIASG